MSSQSDEALTAVATLKSQFTYLKKEPAPSAIPTPEPPFLIKPAIPIRKPLKMLPDNFQYGEPFDEESTDTDTKALAFSFPTFDRSKYYGIGGEVATLASHGH